MMNYTQEDITQAYSAAMDSVNLIKAGKPQNMKYKVCEETL